MVASSENFRASRITSQNERRAKNLSDYAHPLEVSQTEFQKTLQALADYSGVNIAVTDLGSDTVIFRSSPANNTKTKKL